MTPLDSKCRVYMREEIDILLLKCLTNVLLVVMVIFLLQRPTAANPASVRHDECVRASVGSLGNVILKNICSDRVDMKWCHMTTDGRNVGCQVERDLDPGWHVETGVCSKCRWKISYEIVLTSSRNRLEFSSDAQMLADLKSKRAIK
jgi:hypothetical protein